MENLYINFIGTESHYIDDIKENFKCSQAYKYLKGYEQKNNSFIELFDIGDIDEEINENYHIEEASVLGYGNDDWQDFYFYFDVAIKKNREAIEELKYFLQDLEFYFKNESIAFTGYVENTKNIDGDLYIHKEELDSIIFDFMGSDTIENVHIKEYILECGYNPDDYNIICDTDNIIYN